MNKFLIRWYGLLSRPLQGSGASTTAMSGQENSRLGRRSWLSSNTRKHGPLQVTDRHHEEGDNGGSPMSLSLCTHAFGESTARSQ